VTGEACASPVSIFAALAGHGSFRSLPALRPRATLPSATGAGARVALPTRTAKVIPCPPDDPDRTTREVGRPVGAAGRPAPPVAVPDRPRPDPRAAGVPPAGPLGPQVPRGRPEVVAAATHDRVVALRVPVAPVVPARVVDGVQAADGPDRAAPVADRPPANVDRPVAGRVARRGAVPRVGAGELTGSGAQMVRRVGRPDPSARWAGPPRAARAVGPAARTAPVGRAGRPAVPTGAADPPTAGRPAVPTGAADPPTAGRPAVPTGAADPPTAGRPAVPTGGGVRVTGRGSSSPRRNAWRRRRAHVRTPAVRERPRSRRCGSTKVR
jgi:hypothetical protein